MILIAAYLCGSIPTGLWLGRLIGVDVRAAGSGNIGATNVARTIGARLGVLTLIVDVAKGALPMVLARAVGASAVGLALVGICTVAGHIFSIFARFRGGKGVATSAGVFLVLAPFALAGAVAVFAVAMALSRRVSVASLCASGALPVFLAAAGDWGPRLWAGAAIALALVLTHRDNLRRLAAGTEPRFIPRRSSKPPGG